MAYQHRLYLSIMQSDNQPHVCSAQREMAAWLLSVLANIRLAYVWLSRMAAILPFTIQCPRESGVTA
jgi:hypothetical protein